MKKVLLMSTLLLVAFAIAAHAQETTAEGTGLVGYGIKLGVPLANFTGSDATPPTGVDKKMRIGFGGGAFLTYAFSPMFAVQPELLYMMKGTKWDSAGTSLTYKLDYLQIPVLLKVMPETGGKIKPAIFVGPYVGFLLSASGALSLFGADFDLKDRYKSTEFGLSFGAGVNFLMSKGAITFDGRYDLGLSKIEKSQLGEQANIKTGTITFLLGYTFK